LQINKPFKSFVGCTKLFLGFVSQDFFAVYGDKNKSSFTSSDDDDDESSFTSSTGSDKENQPKKNNRDEEQRTATNLVKLCDRVPRSNMHGRKRPFISVSHTEKYGDIRRKKNDRLLSQYMEAIYSLRFASYTVAA
jgi:hypothetical protein